MKRLLLGIVLLICTSVMGFTQEEKRSNNILFSVGLANESGFFNGTGLENEFIGSLGVSFNLYSFFDQRNVGLFFNASILRPLLNDYDSLGQTDIIPFGVGYRFRFNENFMLHFGFGPSLNMTFLHDKNNIEITGDYIYGLGLGGDIGVNYKFAKLLSFNIGTTVTYNFMAYREIRRNVDYQKPNRDIVESGWVNKYSMIGIKPYFAIGFNF